MRLNIFLATGAIISSAFALPASSQTSSQRPRNEKETEGGEQHDLLDRLVDPVWLASATTATYLGYHGLRYLLTPEGQSLKQNLNRRLDEWRQWRDTRKERLRLLKEKRLQEERFLELSDRHGYRRRTGDLVIIQAPNGQEVQVTWTEKILLTDCIRLVQHLKVDHQSKFRRCLVYAQNPGIKIEDVLNVDQPLELPEVQRQGDDTTEPNNNHSHFSKAIVERGRQVIGTAGESIKKNLLGVVAPLASVRRNKGGFIALPGHLQNVPRLGAIPPL